MYSLSTLKQLAKLVNDYWISENPEVGDCSWRRGSYMIGNMAAYELTGEQTYLSYALDWANENGWRFYNDTDYTTTNADYQICGQTYLKLHELGYGTDEHMRKSMQHILNDPACDYWWWIDAVYMALPYFYQMGVKYQDERYFDKGYRLFVNIKEERTCYDTGEHLWYRDERFLPDKQREPNGEKIFWSRGNGWLFGGLARTLAVLPEESKYYAKYLQVFSDMAERLKALMNREGYYTCSLLDPQDWPMPETSGTALFTLGYLTGFRLGILDQSYLQTAMKCFDWLTYTALNKSGRIGYTQGVAWGPNTNIEQESSYDYVVGTYLLILQELAQLF